MISTTSGYCDAGKWVRRYQRNNKQSGLKNLRCFPFCSDIHRIRGFCGHGVVAYISLHDPMMKDVSPDNIRCWAAFIRYDDPFNQYATSSGVSSSNGNKNHNSSIASEEYDIHVNQIISNDHIEKWTRSPASPFKPWYLGECIKEDDEDININFASQGINVNQTLLFAFNKQRKGWHYGWTANKHTCDDPHILRTYVCAAQPGTNSLRCIGRIDSPPFTIFCRRRQREHVADLPSQLMTLEHLQLRKKEYQAMIEHNPQLVQKMIENELAASLTKLAEGDGNRANPPSSSSRNRRSSKPSSSSAKKRRASSSSDELDEVYERELVVSSEKARRVVPSRQFGAMINDNSMRKIKRQDVFGYDNNSNSNDDASIRMNFSSSSLSALPYLQQQQQPQQYQQSYQQSSHPPMQMQMQMQQQQQYYADAAAVAASANMMQSTSTPIFQGLENDQMSPSASMSGESDNDFFFTLADDFFLDGITSFNNDGSSDTSATSNSTSLSSTNPTSSSSSSLPPQAQNDTLSLETMIFTIMSALTDVHGSAANDSSSSSSSVNNNGDRRTPSSPRQYNAADLDEFTKTIADCLDTLISQDSKISSTPFGRNISATSIPDLINRPESRTSIASGVRNSLLDSILESMATNLLEETDISEEISNALRSMKEKSNGEGDKDTEDESLARKAFVSVLEKQLNKLLARHSITIPDLYNMIIKSQETNDGNNTATSAMNNGNSNIPIPSIKSETKPNMDNLLKEYIEDQSKSSMALTHQAINSLHEKKPKLIVSTSRQRLTEMLLQVVNETLLHNDLRYLIEDLGNGEANGDEPSVPSTNVLQPTMDIAGKWRRPESTLKILEKLRERVGMSWLIRKMVKDMESTFEIDINSARMIVFNKKKLMSSGYHDYVFDGKLRPYNLKSPIPGEKVLSGMVACAALHERCGCIIFMQRYSETIRLVRATIRNIELNEIQSVVMIQARHNAQSAWQSQITANVRAIPQDEEEDTDEMADKITANNASGASNNA